MNKEKTYPTTPNYQMAQRPAEEKAAAATDVIEFARQYAREKPEVVALWCFGIGFVLGWKLKPW